MIVGRSKKLIITVQEYERLLQVIIKASAHDTQQWTMSIDASGPRCKTLCALIAIWYLRLVKLRRYHDIILPMFFLLCVYLYKSVLYPIFLPHCRVVEHDYYLFYNDALASLISYPHTVFTYVNFNMHATFFSYLHSTKLSFSKSLLFTEENQL